MKPGHPLGALWATRENLPLFYPRNAINLSSTSTGTPWTWSAWGQIVASTSEDFMPTIVHLMIRINTLAVAERAVSVEYEIGVGAASSEVPIFSTPYAYGHIVSSPGPSTVAIACVGQSLPVGPTIIPSGSRIAHRVRISIDDTEGTVIIAPYIGGFAGGKVPVPYPPYPLYPHLAGIHRAQSISTPTGADTAVTVGTPFGTYGSWVQLIASAPVDLLVWSLSRQFQGSAGSRAMYAEIGTGGAGVEVPRGRLAFPSVAFGNSQMESFLQPLFLKAGERVAVRMTGALGINQNVRLGYEEV